MEEMHEEEKIWILEGRVSFLDDEGIDIGYSTIPRQVFRKKEAALHSLYEIKLHISELGNLCSDKYFVHSESENCFSIQFGRNRYDINVEELSVKE